MRDEAFPDEDASRGDLAAATDSGAAHRRLHAELVKDDEYRTAYELGRSYAELVDPDIARAADLFRATNVPGCYLDCLDYPDCTCGRLDDTAE